MKYLIVLFMLISCTQTTYNVGECYLWDSHPKFAFKVVSRLERGIITNIWYNYKESPINKETYFQFVELKLFKDEIQQMDCIGQMK